MTPDEPPIPDDDALAGAARRALGRLADDGVPVAAWEDVHARGRRTQHMRAAVAIAAALLVVVAGAATVGAVHGKGNHVDVAGTDHGGTTTTTEPPSTTTTTTTIPSPPATTAGGGTTPLVIPQFPEAQAGDFEGTLQVASTTLTATEPMPVTLTLRNISDHAVYVPGVRPIGVFLGFYSATGMTGSVALFGPGETRTYTSTITADPSLIGTARLSAAVLEGAGFPVKIGTSDFADLAGVAPVDVTIIPPGWQPGQPLDPSQGKWNVELTSDVDHVAAGAPLLLHVQVTNTGDQPQQTAGYGALAVACPSDQLAFPDGTALPAATLAPGAQQTFDVTVVAAANSAATTMNCSAGLQFPTYNGGAIGDPLGGAAVGTYPGIVSNTLPIALEGVQSTTTAP